MRTGDFDPDRGSPVAEYPNPVFRSIVLRTVGPFVPVWLFGVVVGLFLDRLGLNGSLPSAEVLGFLAFYTLLVWALVAGLLIRQYQSSPEHVEVDVDGVAGLVHRGGGGSAPDPRRRLFLPFERISSVAASGVFGARVEGRPAGGSGVDWLNLTDANAEMLREAWLAWKQREAPETGAPPMISSSPA